jgi:hypothetical protein
VRRWNPTRYDLVARIEDLIAEYNAGSVNIDEYLRRRDSLNRVKCQSRCGGPVSP